MRKSGERDMNKERRTCLYVFKLRNFHLFVRGTGASVGNRESGLHGEVCNMLNGNTTGMQEERIDMKPDILLLPCRGVHSTTIFRAYVFA